MAKNVSVQVKCPKCKQSLMDAEHMLNDKPSIKLNIQLGANRGVIRLCSIYGCYDHESNIDLSGGGIADFTCPHCNQLLNTTEKCGACEAPMVPMNLDMGGRVAVCSRKGCDNHYVAFENPADALARFYDAYGF